MPDETSEGSGKGSSGELPPNDAESAADAYARGVEETRASERKSHEKSVDSKVQARFDAFKATFLEKQLGASDAD